MAPAHPTVLVVDDHEDVRDALKTLLRAEGYAVETAENGREALAALYGGLQPWVIILDLMMPVMGGFEFRQEQLNHPQFAQIPVIVFSSMDDPHAGHLGADAYLQKPADSDRLLALLRKHCLK